MYIRPVPARPLSPLPEPPADAPRLSKQPCAACGEPQEPLRAGAVSAFEDGLRFFCDVACRDAYRGGQRNTHRRTPQRPATPVLDPAKLAELSGPATPEASAAQATQAQSPLGWTGAGAVALASLLALLPSYGLAAAASAGLSCTAAALALAASWPSQRELGWLGWALGPLGAMLAAVAAFVAIGDGGGTWGLLGAALAAATVTARAWFDDQARAPVEHAVRSLSQRMPRYVRVPVEADEDPFSLSMRHVDAEQVRTGEEVVAMAGEVLAVDGVVQVGEATVLPYPGAELPLMRRTGDPVLAGARVLKGAVRVLASRVGDQRALARIGRFGDATAQDASPNVRTGQLVRRWGGLATVGLAAAVAAVASGNGVFGPLAGASAVLVAAPLLSLRRAAEAPLRAAAAHAGTRGIVYRSGAALDRAGRVSTVAMAPHGTLTEGKPEVVEVHMMGDGASEALVGLVAAAERTAGDHPIARAIAQLARDRRIAPVEVRRASFIPGRGVTGITAEGEALVVGNRRFLLDEGISVAVADSEAARAETSGRTPIFVSIGGRIRAVITLQDHLRAGARAAIQRLFDLNLEVVLLTGDQRGPIESLAAGLDIAHVKAELLPRERGMEVRRLRDAGGKVAVIGYPLEDDEALGAADVGIVLDAAGGAGGERAVALVSEDVRDAAAALWIAHAAREGSLRTMRVAGGVFALVVAAGLAGMMPPGIAALLAVGVDAFGVRVGARLLRRFALRLPAPSVGS